MGYDSADFVADLRQACVTPHVAQKSQHSAVPSRRMQALVCRATDGRTTRHENYVLSIKHCKRIEEAFGYAKTAG